MMNNPTLYPVGCFPAMEYAAQALEYQGYAVAKEPTPDVTHVLLPVPSFEEDGSIKGGGSLKELLDSVPQDAVIFGGNLDRPELANCLSKDFLRDPRYLAENAAITAHCAVCIAMEKLPVTLPECPVLVIGWGRIGKCLAALLKALGANVTIAARKEADRAMAHGLGYSAVDIQDLSFSLIRYRVVFNTVPAPVLGEAQMECCRKDAVKIDLASVPGMTGDDVIRARGLPGKMAPEASGKLIARTAIRLIRKKE